jgi:hypothetical protein
MMRLRNTVSKILVVKLNIFCHKVPLSPPLQLCLETSVAEPHNVYAALALVETRLWRMVISSPVSFLCSGTSRSTLGGRDWRIDRGVQNAYIIINSL